MKDPEDSYGAFRKIKELFDANTLTIESICKNITTDVEFGLPKNHTARIQREKHRAKVARIEADRALRRKQEEEEEEEENTLKRKRDEDEYGTLLL